MRENELALAPAPAVVRLDFGCGQNPKDGFEGVDLYAPNATHKVDLWKFPLPWADGSVDEIHASHFVEHLPARDVEPRDVLPGGSDRIGQDFLFAFFDECYRILKPRGSMTVIVPCARNNRAFQDPTHRRFIVAETFGYLSAEWRKSQGLDHYRVACDFEISVGHTMFDELSLLHPEAQARRFNESWNTIIDWHATLIKK